MLTDIEIAKRAHMQNIAEIAKNAGIAEHELYMYGKHKAKIELSIFDRLKDRKDGKLILVTAINPTPAGEGKTTMTVGLGQALSKIGLNAGIALREPSLGPVFGVKGGAAGGGYSQVVPMEDINLHFTGDIHAVTAANNLLCAMIDNHLHHGNQLGIDPSQIVWKRVMDVNDRAIRNTVVGLGGKINGVAREDGFMITVASEVMAILCLATDLDDLKSRIGDIVVAYTYGGAPVTARDLKASGAMAALLKEAIKPNLVQTLENTPCFIHGGPFANIAHGCNSVIATKLALKLFDYVVTEAGFGADLGAEKFLDIVCPSAGIVPHAVVIVATVRALKYNGGVAKLELKSENTAAVEAGIVNLQKHIENMQSYGLPVVVALNSFNTDTEAEKQVVLDFCAKMGVECAMATVFEDGGAGGVNLANAVVAAVSRGGEYHKLYDHNLTIEEKINAIATKIYGAGAAILSPSAKKSVAKIAEMGYSHLPICMAKTQYSLSDNPAKLGRPHGFDINIKEVKLSAGAGFIVALSGEIMTMPGLGKTPAAHDIDIDNDGNISGLF